jgi:hypothetical protein
MAYNNPSTPKDFFLEKRKDPIRRSKWKIAHSTIVERWRVGLGFLAGTTASVVGATHRGSAIESPNSQLSPPSASQTISAEEILASQNTIPFVERVSSERLERVAVPPIPEKIGVLVDIKLQDLGQYLLTLEKTEKDVLLKAVPYYATGAHVDWPYRLHSNDPLRFLNSNADSAAVNAALASCRESILQTGYAHEIALDPKFTRKPIHELPVIREDPNTDSHITIATIPNDKKIVLRIELGAVNSHADHWVQRAISSPSELIAKMESIFNKHDPWSNFIERSLTSPESGKIDIGSHLALTILFALDKEGRDKFLRAIQINDLDVARMILAFHSGNISVKDQTFEALKKYATSAISYGLSKKDAESLLYECLDPSTTYNDPEWVKQHLDRLERGTPQHTIGQTLPIDLLRDLCKLPDEIKLHLISYVFDDQNSQRYQDYERNLRETLTKPPRTTTEQPEIDILPPHTVQAIRENISNLSGGRNSNGWLDITDRTRNLLTMMALAQQKHVLYELRDSLSGANGNLGSILQHQDGKSYLVIELDPKKDIKHDGDDHIYRKDQFLAALRHVAQAILQGRQLMGSPTASSTVGEDISTFFASDNPASDAPTINSSLVSNYQLIRLLQSAPITTPSIAKFLSSSFRDMHGHSTSLKTQQAGFAVSDIVVANQQETHEQGIHAANVEEEVRLPTGSSARR